MLVTKEKYFVHFYSKGVDVYHFAQGTVTHIKHVNFSFNNDILTICDQVDHVFNTVKTVSDEINNEIIRIYASGLFHDFSDVDQMKLVIHFFVYNNLLFNIISPDLEQFYINQSLAANSVSNIIYGLVQQEFRNVVICGSFQQHLQDIGDVKELLESRKTQVLSPWTTKIVPETLGTDFILLEGQELVNSRDAWRHKYEHMDKFRRSDAIIVCNPDGLIGTGTMFEFGFMVANAKRIIFTDRPTNLYIPFPYEVGLNITTSQ